MNLGSDSTGFSDPTPDFIAVDWHTDPDPLYFFDPNFAFEDTSLSQNLFEAPLSFCPPVGDFHPIFAPEMTMGTPSFQAARQHALSSPQGASGTSGTQHRTTETPPDNNARNCDPRYEGVIGGAHSSVTVPTIPSPVPLPPSAPRLSLNWIKIPQRRYEHGRGRPGINMGDALRKTFVGLDGRDDPVLQDTTGGISCRFLFPGYPVNGSPCQIPTLDWTRKRLPITRSKLAHEVSKKLERYLRDMAKLTPEESVQDQWKIGQGFMRIDNMFLIHLVSVSKGSFQPEIWVVDPSKPHACADS